jgi:hypothetical protein
LTVRTLLKCEVCGSVTMLRTQIGWLDEHPIRIYCGKCGILISGTLFLDQKNVTGKFVFKNASEYTVATELIPDYYIEASGELITKKLKKFDKKQSPLVFISPPFFNTITAMGEENYMNFKECVVRSLSLIKNDWFNFRRIYELWLQGKYTYLQNEVIKYLPRDKFPTNNELEYLRSVHTLNLMFFLQLMDKKRFTATTEFIFNEIDNLTDRNMPNFIKLIEYFENKKLLQLYSEEIFKQYIQFIEIFHFLIPVFGLRFYKNKKETLYNDDGLTTASFDDLKQIYLDSFEIGAKIISLVIAFNNLKYRNDFTKMKNNRPDIKLISDYETKSHGIRIDYIDNKEIFDRLVYSYFDNRLRNAIAHKSYKYDGISQLITYYPSGVLNKGKEEKIFLLKFAENCWNLFLTIIDLDELTYQTRKILYVSKGCKPIDPKVFD